MRANKERESCNALLGNPIQGRIVVETKVTSMDNVIGVRLLGKFVEGADVSW
jgi:hypothetical protein